MSKIPDCRTDKLITSMLDGYGEKEYQKIKEHVDGRQGKAENG